MKKTLLLPFLSFSFLACQAPVAKHETPVAKSVEASAPAASGEDPYLWLEDVQSEKSLNWVKAQNAVSTKRLESLPQFEPIRKKILSIANSKERIPGISKLGKYCYNFWRDEKNTRGILRRTTLDEYKKPEPAWELVLDLDAMAKAENENWVWKGYTTLYPTYDRCLLSLSRGGGDAVVKREFDLVKKEIVADGFSLPEAKSNVAWKDRDTLFVGTDFGPGSMTDSGYPRLVKEWKRGTPLSDAKLVYEGKASDISVSAYVDHDHGRDYVWLNRGTTFYTSEEFLRRGNDWVKIDKPDDAGVGTYMDQLLFTLRNEWTVGGKTYPSGAMLAIGLEDFFAGKRDFQTLFEPGPRKSLASSSATKNFLIVNELDNVKNKAFVMQHANGHWTRTQIEIPSFGSVGVSAVDEEESDDYFLFHSDFLTPSSMYMGSIGKPDREKLKSLPAFFNAEGLEINQYEASSKDGTKIPYFQVSRKGLKLDGNNPTLLYGYGGFQVSMLPSYSAGMGSAWLERGGVYVLSNIRGGGEFGPAWHEAARKEHRQRAYDDFIAIAEDLIARKVTSSKHLGIQGGSNGGLLMGVMLTERPDLFKAVLCQVPLLDMKRYHKLLAGASWMAEYGNPDEEADWAYIQKYSPYQNVRPNTNYPSVLFTSSTRDDRVHPGHGRKMVARMQEMGYAPLYYENIEGGHGGAANNEQTAYMNALGFSFLIDELFGKALPQ